MGKVTDFLPQSARSRDGQPGQITDDSTPGHYRSGRAHWARSVRAGLVRPTQPDRLFVTERLVLEKLRLGMSPWETGRGQLAADAAIMAIAPLE
jgi:hypothetical protein